MCVAKLETALLILQDSLPVHNRSSVALPCKDDIVHDRKRRDTASDHDSPVHHFGCWVHLCGPEAEEDDEQQVADCYCVVGNTKLAFEAPRAPGKTAVVGFRVVRRGVEDVELIVLVVEVAAHTTPEQQADGEQVGKVEALEYERDGSIKSGTVADVDEGEESGEDCHNDNGDHRNGAALVDLRKVRVE